MWSRLRVSIQRCLIFLIIIKNKLAISINSDIYDSILEHFGKRGFSRFNNITALELIKKMKK